MADRSFFALGFTGGGSTTVTLATEQRGHNGKRSFTVCGQGTRLPPVDDPGKKENGEDGSGEPCGWVWESILLDGGFRAALAGLRGGGMVTLDRLLDNPVDERDVV